MFKQRSLIKIREDNQLWMHDLLRDIGKKFIRQGSGKKPEKQQWVWTHEQASEVLDKMQVGGDVRGIDSIEAICFKLDKLSQYSLIKECLARLLNLRFLQVDNKDFNRETKSITQAGRFLCYWCPNFLQTAFGPLILPELRWLSWNCFPMVFNLTNFFMRKLVILDFSMSKVTEKWNGWSHVKLAENLKVLNLTECQKLRETPKFSCHKKLERLILEGCESLVQIDPSISHLKKLVFLNLKYCHNLRKLPDEMEALESLIELLLDYTSIEEIPEWRRMKKLEILSLDMCTSLNRFSLVGCTTSVVKLSLVNNHFTQLPGSIGNFISLIEMDLSSSTIEELPDSIGNMKNLKVLKMGNSSVKKLPSTIGMLEKLEELKVGGNHLEGEIPGDIGKLRFLRTLVSKGFRISTLPQLPESLITLYFYTFSMDTMPDLSNLLNLRTLQLQVFRVGSSKLEESPSPWWIGRLRKLKFLDLYTSRIATLSSDLVLLSQLKELLLRCRNLQCLPRLPLNLSYLGIKFCRTIKTTNDLSNLKALSDLDIFDCDELTEIQGLEGLENLRRLKLSTLPSLVKLPDLTNLKKLKKIDPDDCANLSEIQGLPESLEILHITKCFKLQQLPDPSSFKNLKLWYVNVSEIETGLD